MGFEVSTEKEIAIKVDPVESKESTLEREAKFYRLVKGGTGVPNLYWYGIEHNYRALVTDFLGPSLDQLLKYCKGAFSLKTVLLIADQILDRIEWIHSKGLVYNNIDPSKFVVGLEEKQDKIFVIDFGNCQKYLDEDGNHFSFQNETASLNWNPCYRSINSHINKSKDKDMQKLAVATIWRASATCWSISSAADSPGTRSTWPRSPLT